MIVEAEERKVGTADSSWSKHLVPHGTAFAKLAVAVVVVAFVLCEIHKDFWFEDDAPHRVFVRDHGNPLAYFGPELVSKLSLGHSVTPYFPLTFWIDRQFSALNPLPAYLHSAFSLWLTACALYLLLARFMSTHQATVTAGLWLLLPSTQVTVEFLSTRHYLEGFLFSLLAVYVALNRQHGSGKRRRWGLALALGLFLLACTTKEVYVTACFLALLLVFFEKRGWLEIALLFGCGGAYTIYRFISLDAVAQGAATPFVAHYYRFFERWPFMFAGNVGGYVLVLLALVLMVTVWLRGRLPLKQLFYAAGMTGVMLLTILPVSEHVTEAYLELGTWYRVLFLLNSFVLVLGALLVCRLDKHWVSRLSCGLAFVVLFYGTTQSLEKWDERKAAYRQEAEFYLQHDDRLLYSTMPAFWYLYGIHRLYKPELEPHYLTYHDDGPCELVEGAQEVWTAGSNGIYRDDALLMRLRENCRQKVVPLHQGWSPQ